MPRCRARCACRGRRRRDRAGHAVHRSDGGRPGDPGSEPAQPRRRHAHRRCTRHRQGVPRAPRPGAAGADGLCQSDDDPRRRLVRGGLPGCRRRRRDLRGHPARGRPRTRPGPARRKRRPHPARDADQRRRTPARDPQRLVGLPLLCLGRRDHRQAAAAQASIESAVARLKAATDLPVAVGFGVRTPEQAAAIGAVRTASWSARPSSRSSANMALPQRRMSATMSPGCALPSTGRSRSHELAQPRPQRHSLHRQEVGRTRQSLAQMPVLRADGVHEGMGGESLGLPALRLSWPHRGPRRASRNCSIRARPISCLRHR